MQYTIISMNIHKTPLNKRVSYIEICVWNDPFKVTTKSECTYIRFIKGEFWILMPSRTNHAGNGVGLLSYFKTIGEEKCQNATMRSTSAYPKNYTYA